MMGLAASGCVFSAGKSASADEAASVETELTVDEKESSGTGPEIFTKYVDYHPVKAEPGKMAEGDNHHILTVWFSRSGNTSVDPSADAVSSASLTINSDRTTTGNAEQMADWIADESGSDSFLIQTEYTLPVDYDETVKVGEGLDIDSVRPSLASHLDSVDSYDTVFLVTPIWHYTVPEPVMSFLDEYDFSGKKIVVFTTHAGSGFADTIDRIKEAEPGADVSEGIAVRQGEVENSEDEVREAARKAADPSEDAGKRTAKDNAEMQTEDKTIATRKVPENGTAINIRFGDEAVIKGVLNDSETAKAFIEKLPYTIHMGHYSHDFCGVTEELPYSDEEEHYGWLNGDIDYATDAPYFTILYKDEDISEQFGYQVNIGVVTSPLDELDKLGNSYDVTVELAEESSDTGAAEQDEDHFSIEINGTKIKAAFEQNSSADAFRKLLAGGPVAVDLHDYGSFEKVGDLGTSLPTNDQQITTSPGDIILYQGNQITIYYDQNTWNFTKLGKIEGLTQEELKEILGDGNVTAVFSLEQGE